MTTTSITKIYIYSLNYLKKTINNLNSRKKNYEQINLKFMAENINDYDLNDDFTNKLSSINLIKNLYITINYKNSYVLTKKLIEITPEKIIKLKLRLDCSTNYKLNLETLINLKKLFLKKFSFDTDIIKFLCKLLMNNINLQNLYLSSPFSSNDTYYEAFLSKILNALKNNNNLQNLTINSNNMMKDINNKSYYKYYKEIMDLVENNKYTPDKLLILYKDLQENITNINRTKVIYESIQEENSIISLAINSAEVTIKEKTLIYNNALQYAINNINTDKVIAEAIYILAQELQLSEPLESYRILNHIPGNFEEIYKKANYSMAHTLLSLEESDFPKLYLSSNLQYNKPNKIQMIISHLSESGSEDKDLLSRILNEYIFNNGIVESKDNPFESIPIEKELFPKTSNLLFVLNAWKKHAESSSNATQEEQNKQLQENITQPKLHCFGL